MVGVGGSNPLVPTRFRRRACRSNYCDKPFFVFASPVSQSVEYAFLKHEYGCMHNADYLGATSPTLILYLPHRPNEMTLDVAALLAANSNHWRKIVTLLAKVACPVESDWRHFRDEVLFRETALCFMPELVHAPCWHWIGGKENLSRFTSLQHNAQHLQAVPGVAIDPQKRLLLTPYPDYRQLSNALVERVRGSLEELRFYHRNDV